MSIGIRLVMVAAGAIVVACLWANYHKDPGALIPDLRHVSQGIQHQGPGWEHAVGHVARRDIGRAS